MIEFGLMLDVFPSNIFETILVLQKFYQDSEHQILNITQLVWLVHQTLHV